MKKVLMIVGSLRKNSFNRQLAEIAGEMLKDRAQVSYLEYGDLPYMNQDIEYPAPEGVAAVRQAVQEADGVWIFSPEYNYQIPGVLKNLLDWLSRPLAPNDWERGSAVKGKIATISGAAGKSGAAGARKNLSMLLQAMSMQLIGGVGTGISMNAEVFMSGELKLSEEDLDALRDQANELLGSI